MINDDQAEKAADYIRDNAEEYAKAKAQRIYLDNYGKSLKAILFRERNEGSVADREAAAFSHEKYQAHLEELKKAVFEEEKLKGLISAAEMKIEVWRSQSANMRGKI